MDGVSTDYEYNSSTITFKIPAESSYTITFANLNNYRTPESINRIAVNNNVLSFTIQYLEILYGVYIMDNYGNLHKPGAWIDGPKATGVALITDNIQIVISPDILRYITDKSFGSIAERGGYYGGYNYVINNVETSTSSNIILNDYNGQNNTINLIYELAGKSTDTTYDNVGAAAAEFCWLYSNGCKGVGEWYLPSAGEMNEIAQNLDEINEALAKISGTALDVSTYNEDGSISNYWTVWTSSQSDAKYAWVYKFIYKSLSSISKSNSENLRAISKLNSTQAPEVNFGYFTIEFSENSKEIYKFFFKKGDTWEDFFNSSYINGSDGDARYYYDRGDNRYYCYSFNKTGDIYGINKLNEDDYSYFRGATIQANSINVMGTDLLIDGYNYTISSWSA